MTKPRRGVRFPNRLNNGHVEGRRSSMSEVSEDGSGSPVRTRSVSATHLDNISEVLSS